MNNKLKNEKYANLMRRMKKALKYEFYFESILIEYAILEDRTESLLRHANVETKDKNGNPLMLYKKINLIKGNKAFNNKYAKKHLKAELFDSINEWRIKRNNVIHGLVKLETTEDEIKNIALEGYEIVRILNNKSTLVNKYFDKNREE